MVKQPEDRSRGGGTRTDAVLDAPVPIPAPTEAAVPAMLPVGPMLVPMMEATRATLAAWRALLDAARTALRAQQDLALEATMQALGAKPSPGTPVAARLPGDGPAGRITTAIVSVEPTGAEAANDSGDAPQAAR